MKTSKVGLVFGGKSAEHDISLISAKTIHSHLDRSRFSPVLIYINRRGQWSVTANEDFQENAYTHESFQSFLPWEGQKWIHETADIYFPILHGPFGEDGRMQSVFEIAGKPFVGAGSFSSALAMDKVVSKILFLRAGLQVADFLYFTSCDWDQIREMVQKKFAFPLFVKPCSLGSSVGISKVKGVADLEEAVRLAFSYDNKILVEEALDVREIEISVMGNDEVMVSRPGEVIPHEEFYDYKDKYLLNKTQFRIPVDLGIDLENRVRKVAQKAYRSLFLNGMGRVDLFLEKGTGEIYVNEINTIPGFTTISMFPKLWEAQGIGFPDLVTQLIEYGFAYSRTMNSRVDVPDNPGH